MKFDFPSIRPHVQTRLSGYYQTAIELANDLDVGILRFKLTPDGRKLITERPPHLFYKDFLTELLLLAGMSDGQLVAKEADFIYQVIEEKEAAKVSNYSVALNRFCDGLCRTYKISGLNIVDRGDELVCQYRALMSLIRQSSMYSDSSELVLFNVIYLITSKFAEHDEGIGENGILFLVNITERIRPSSIGGSMKGMDNALDGDKHPDHFEKLSGLIGLPEVKMEVRKLINFAKIKDLRKKSGLSVPSTSNHLVFVGNPGTGKTVVARILGEIFASLGYLSKGHLVETDRSALVAGFVGQTAIKTKAILDEAMGGVLFIDEAYSLAKEERGSDYGQEAIDTVLKFMEDKRDDFIVIVAGYEDLMNRFISSNPGLRSRFPRVIKFHDYETDELVKIFTSIAVSSGYAVDSNVCSVLKQVIASAMVDPQVGFGNARYVRNLFENCIQNQADRLSLVASPTEQDLQTIFAEDLGSPEFAT